MKRFWLITAIFIFTVGCSSKKQAEKTKIVWSFWGGREVAGLYQEIAGDFEKGHPHIKVNLLQIPGGPRGGEKIQTMIAAGIAPDIMWVPIDVAYNYARKGIILGLNRFIEDDKDFHIEDFYPVALEPYTYDGIIYGIDGGFTIDVMYYNKTLFDKENVPYPDKDWTWEDFLHTAQMLTKDHNEDGKIDQYGFVGWTIARAVGGNWWVWVWQNDGEVIYEETRRCVIDSPEVVEALQFWKDLFAKHKVMPDPWATKQEEAWQMFKMGRVAMFDGGTWGLAAFRDVKEFDWDIAPLPRGKKKATLIGSAGLAISSQSKNPDAAWKFISYITGTTGGKKYFGSALSEGLSSRKSLLTSIKKHSSQNVIVESMEFARHLPCSYPRYQEIDEAINSELELAWLEKETVAEACSKAREKVNELLLEK